MAAIHRLRARAAATAKAPGLYADGGGLYLRVTHGCDGKPRRSWVLRYNAPDGRRREMGLGPADIVGLADARETALAGRKQAKVGVDPIEARKQARGASATARAKSMTFRQCAEAYLATHASSWKNAKHRWQWQKTLEVYAYPIIRDTPVGEIDFTLVMAVLDPIWLTKTETASRVRGRIETILDWARVRGYRRGDNPARWRGHLQKALPTIKESLRVRHHPALPFAEAPDFMRKLVAQDGKRASRLVVGAGDGVPARIARTGRSQA